MSYIAKFLNAETNEYVLEENGCTYPNDDKGKFDFIHIEIVKFCGCGRPKEAMLYLRDTLAYLDLKESAPHPFKEKEAWDAWYADWEAKKSILFPDERAFWFMLYFLDREGFEEHGGSTPGWLTEEGKGLLADLTELLGPTTWTWETVMLTPGLMNNEQFVSKLHVSEALAKLLKAGKEIPPHHPELIKIIKELELYGMIIKVKDPLYKLTVDGVRWDARQW